MFVDAALCLRHVHHIQAAPILFSLTSQTEEEERIYVEKHVWVKSLQTFSKEEHVWVKGLQALSKEKHCLVSTSYASHPGRSYSLLLNQETLALRLLDSTCMCQAGRDHAPGDEPQKPFEPCNQQAYVLKTQQWVTTIKNAERARLHMQEELMSPVVVI